jgi:hypothetical protein
MRDVLLVCAALLPALGSAQAAEKATRFWNLTGETITHLNLAPAGTTKWGPDQCRNDPDGTVDFDERLTIKGVGTGHYDVKFTDKTGRSCLVSNVEVKSGGVFSIGKDELTHCTGK